MIRRSSWVSCSSAAMLVLLLASTPSPIAAQSADRAPARAGPAAQGRVGLERQFRERLAEIVRRRLKLDERQMQQLGEVNDRFERDRMLLLRDERQVRQSLRAEVLLGESANQSRVADLLDQALKVQQRRLELTSREQRELAGFMTPVQRAMYFGIQDDLRRRLEDIRQDRQQRQRRSGGLGVGTRRPPPS